MNQIICPHCGEENTKENIKCFECKNELILNNRYKLLKVLGENIGITYLALDNSTSNLVVIKELSIKAIDRWKTEELFKREGDVLAKLNHKNIPKFIEQFTMDIDKNITYYLVIEHIDGIRLDNELKNKRYSEDDIFDLVKEITKILKYLQDFNPAIIHRDIKLSNLIRRNDTQEITLIDFGGVKDVMKPNTGSTVAGTFGYAAPEQLLGKVVPQSDYYSLGMVALVLLTRRDAEDLISNLDLSSRDYNNFSNKMVMLLDKLIANKVRDRFINTEEILEFLNKDKNSFKNRAVAKKVIKKSSGKNIDRFLYDFDTLDEIWKGIKKRNNVIGYILAIGSALLLFGGMFAVDAVNIIWPIFLAGFVLFQYKKKNLKIFLDKAFNETDIEDVAIYSYYEYINMKKIIDNGKEDKLFKGFSRKLTINKTKLMLYRKSIEKHRGAKKKPFLRLF